MRMIHDAVQRLAAYVRGDRHGAADAGPSRLVSRDVNAARRPPGGGEEVFDTPDAERINRARLEHIDSLGLPIAGKSVLDAGSGVGHHAAFYAARGCRILCVDAREENVRSLKGRYPTLDARVADVERDGLADFGPFDIVHCYGLLYHLESPLAALRNMAAACREFILLETIICDHPLPVLRIEDETMSSNQALSGLGCRPSPGFVVMALNRAGFPFVYAPRQPPDHEDFRFRCLGNLDTRRDGHNLRCVFVGAKHGLHADTLELLVGPE